MKTINFATIGTSWITEEFINTLKTVPDTNLYCVYSRDICKAEAFAEKHGAAKFTSDLKNLVSDKNINAVYIASPNSCHAEQSIMMLNAKKNVICEKPIASNVRDFLQMKDAAKKNEVLLMEAYKALTMPTMKEIKDNIPKLGKIRSAFISFGKYSTRYDAHKEGKNVNTFKAEFSNGALMDLGIYCIYPIVMLFGMPSEIKALSQIVDGGVDGVGTAIMKYDGFVATADYCKISDSFLPCQITGENATMIIDKISIPEKIEIHYRDKNKECEIISPVQRSDSMFYEINEFTDCIRNGRKESETNTFELSEKVLLLTDEIRRQCGIIFPADK